jgi:Holliday junction resolvase RusA-like endonuclease
MDQFVFRNFPMPPTVNKSYRPGMHVSLDRHGRTISELRINRSQKLKSYSHEIENYKLMNLSKIGTAKAFVRQWLMDGFFVRCDMHFMWPEDKIFAKNKKTLLRLDADNRVKAARDALGKCLGLDDTYFICGQVEKSILHQGGSPCVIIRLMKTRIRTEIEILNEYQTTVAP